MNRLLLVVLSFLFAFASNADVGDIVPTNSIKEEKPITFSIDIPQVSGVILGDFQSSDGNKSFSFLEDGIFTYRLHKNLGLEDGVYERSSCAITDRKTGEVLNQGNFMFYFNENSCCYDVKLKARKLLVLNMIWEKEKYSGGRCPTTNLRYVPKK